MECSLPPNLKPMEEKGSEVCLRQRYIATCRGKTMSVDRLFDFKFPRVTLKYLQVAFCICSTVTSYSIKFQAAILINIFTRLLSRRFTPTWEQHSAWRKAHSVKKCHPHISPYEDSQQRRRDRPFCLSGDDDKQKLISIGRFNITPRLIKAPRLVGNVARHLSQQ